MPTLAEVAAMLTGAGGAFEIAMEDIGGIATKVFKQRMRSLREVSRLAAGRDPAETFLVYGDRRIGFASFVARADGISRALAARGIAKGDRVAILSANNPEWCLAFWACVDAGIVCVGLNGWWKSDEILYGLADSGARVLIADHARFVRIANQLESCPDLEKIYVVDPHDGDLADGRVQPFSVLEGGHGASGQAGAEREVAAVEAGLETADPLSWPIDEDDVAVIFYTSGTTGRPKGAISTHRTMIANLQNSFYAALAGALANPGHGIMPTGDSTQIASLLTSPLFHVSGCHSGLVVAIASGIKLVMLEGKFEPEKVLRLIENERVTIWTGVPTMVWRVVEDPHVKEYDLSSVRSVAYGGSPSTADLLHRVQETFPNVKAFGNAYGLTESCSAATINSGTDMELHPESVGRALPVIDIRVVDEEGRDVATGSTGEVWIKGSTVMPGYWHDPEATAEILEDGWLKSGDVGFLDADGLLTITDRAKDMIIRGGENVYCVEIENRLVDHPSIAEAAVIGVPHPTLGEEVKAVVHLEPGEHMRAEDVKAWVAETLANFKVPAYVEFTERYLPRNPSGKILKNVLRGSGDVAFGPAGQDGGDGW